MKGLLDFSVKICFQTRKSASRERTCESYELEFYRFGNGAAVIDGVPYPHKPGNVLFLRPGQKRYTLGSMSCYGLHFSCLNREFAEEYLSRLPTVIHAPETEELFAELIKAEDSAELKSAACLLQILDAILCRPNEKSGRHREEIRRVLRFLDTHYSEPICISELPNRTYLSHTPFFRAFREETGQSPAEYLTQVRLKQAKKLLLDAGLSIGKIAEACGFRNQTYFNDVFRRRFGMSPSAWRHEVFGRVL